MSGPLEGLRVLDLTRLLPGGYATMMLADLGADVIKVEEPGRGDYIRGMFLPVGEYSSGHIALNRNKRSITLNLKHDEGPPLLMNLAETADVIVESFRPGVLDRLGIGWKALSARNPRLVCCAITGYGQDGPRSGEAGHDIDYIAYAGVLGLGGGAPVIPTVQIGDLAGGGMNAVISILAALYRREISGHGDFCDVSMMDGVASWLSIHAGEFVATHHIPRRDDMLLSGAFPCYRVYPAADGYLTVGALEPRFWSALCACLGRDDLVGDAYATGDRRRIVVAELEAIFAAKTRAEWMGHFQGHDVCVAPVNDLAEAFEDPQLRHRGMLVDAEIPGVGGWVHVGNPVRLASAPGKILRLPPPGLGEHTAEVLGEIGISGQRLEALRSAGVV